MLYRFTVGLVAVAASVAGIVPPAPVTAQVAGEWQIGPIIRGRNSSVGMPPTPIPTREGWAFEFPFPHEGAGHVHYLTTRTGSLLGKSKIVMRYRLDVAPGARLVPRQSPQADPTLTLYFQRAGDNWTSRGPFEHFRWYATHANRVVLAPGVHEVSLPLTPHNWKSLGAASGDQQPRQFAEALESADRVGFVLGGGLSAGHGVYATGPARFTLLSFGVID